MKLIFEERPSDSPFVERIWRTRSERIDTFISIAVSQWELVVWTQYGKTQMTVRGPETHATYAPVPDNAEFFGIFFKHGTYMPHLPFDQLINQGLDLPDAGSHSFWLNGSAWQFPTYDNADTFVNRLVREGLIAYESNVEAALHGSLPDDYSLRTTQRRFLRSTGMSLNAVRKIERARYAAGLLRQGISIQDTVFQAGFFDQAHMTHALKRLIGQTPAQIMDISRSVQLSFTYNTTPPPVAYDMDVIWNSLQGATA
ncbi:MAG: helix-turn-helix domain-containing protein [Anaerolineae bacterium]|nr:helix-turn-helix domain-containing protein [Anaerolineae bacterium]